MKFFAINRTITFSCLLLLSFVNQNVKAQLNPLAGAYFQNQYQLNPGMAGLDSGLNVNLGLRQQWSSVPGAPKTQVFTMDYGFGNKVALGLNVNNDEAGLLKRTRVMGTYAYRLPLGEEDQKLTFGLSLGFMSERLDNAQYNANPDINAAKFNDRETYIDGDFGLSYTGPKLTLQGAIPNMKGFFKKDQNQNAADRSTFFAAGSYKLYFRESLDGFGIEPKVCFRGVRGFDNIVDAGANLTFANSSVSLMGMYHSSQSATFGMGVIYNKFLSLMGMYTTETAALRSYASGNFEVALRINLLKRK